ncbi:MAG: DUF4129 domain-containing protein [Thermoplasmata archaeon]
MSAAPRSPRAFSLSWVMILGIALAVGGAAAFLTAAATAPTYSPGPAPLVTISGQAFGWIVLFGVLGVLGFLVFDRVRKGSVPVPTRILAVILTLVVLMTIFAVAGRFLSGGVLPPLAPGSGGNPVPNGNNSTPSNSTTPGGNVTGSGGNLVVFGFSLPPWILFALVVIVGIVVVVVAVRALGGGALPKTGRRRAPSDVEVRAVLLEASAALDTAEEPRELLIRLYGTLLERLTPYVGDTNRQTAEEIRVAHLVLLGIGDATAREITRLFEEARYSPHPIGPMELARAKSAIHQAIAELDAKGADRT